MDSLRLILPIELIKFFIWIDISYSYGYLDKLLLLAQEAWIHPNLDPKTSWCEYLEPIIVIFKIAITSNDQWAINQHMDLNPIFRLWKKKNSNSLLCALLCVWLFEFMKVVELAMV
jgi:hypothetical protein